MMGNEHRVSVWGNENILEVVMMIAQLCEYTRIMDLYILKGCVL